MGWITLGIGLVITAIVELIEHWDAIKKACSSMWNSVKEGFKKGIDAIKAAFQEFLDWWNNTAIGKTINKIFEWFGKIGKSLKDTIFNMFKKSDKVNTPVTVTHMLSGGPQPQLRVPPLAAGAVIPPNNPYLAMVGDQRQGVNIETPLETMVTAFKRAIAESGLTGANQAVMVIDGVSFGQLVYKYNKAESTKIGVSLIQKE
jgi:hypothetical protein